MNPQQEINSIPVGTPHLAVAQIASILNRLSMRVCVEVEGITHCLTDYADKEINELVFGMRVQKGVQSLYDFHEELYDLYRAFSEEARRRDAK